MFVVYEFYLLIKTTNTQGDVLYVRFFSFSRISKCENHSICEVRTLLQFKIIAYDSLIRTLHESGMYKYSTHEIHSVEHVLANDVEVKHPYENDGLCARKIYRTRCPRRGWRGKNESKK